MKKKIMLGLFLLCTICSYANITISDMEPELISIGITSENVGKTKNALDQALKNHKILLIELEQKELEINKLLLDDPEKNWFQINKLFDEIGQINANLKKNQLKTQIEIKKYITKEQYQKAKELYIEKSMNSQKKITN